VKITLGLDSTSLTRRYPRLAVLASLLMALGVPLSLYVAALVLFPLNSAERLDAMAKQWLGFDLAGSPYRNLIYAAFLLLAIMGSGMIAGAVRRILLLVTTGSMIE